VSGPRKRAARLLRWYPRAWRGRYGEEFAELLTADLAERPRSAARTADVIRGGLVARLAGAGLCGCAPRAPELARAHARAGLASPGSLFHPGAIDVAGLAVIALALGVACQAARQSRLGPE
jgi:hypothetical protein